jgi:hypothetical protein
MLCDVDKQEYQDVNSLFVPDSRATATFELALDQLLAVLAPPAKSLTCLESSHSTVADVYLFWLAVMASLEEVITSPDNEIPSEVVEKLRRICNYRFDQMINDAPSDVYLTGFFLHPRA